MSTLFRPSALTAATDEIWKKKAPEVVAKSEQSNGEENKLDLLKKPFDSHASETPAKEAPKQAQPGAFVFGQNIKERAVVVESETPAEQAPSDVTEPVPSTPAKEKLADQSASSLFLATPTASSGGAENSSSSEKLLTGEENEVNVFHASCKLHVLDKDKRSWLERGRGLLRVNDSATGGVDSRVVMRCAGSLRLILNSKISASVVLDRANEKALRFTAFDFETGSVQVYLITANSKESVSLEETIAERIRRAKARTPSPNDSKVPTPSNERKRTASDDGTTTPPSSGRKSADDDATSERVTRSTLAKAGQSPSPKKQKVSADGAH